MHPVIQHILERKGKNVPISDGRKIALILPGGLMSGIRGAGAMIALQELGFGHAFDDIYTSSAGFMNACYLLSDNTKLGTSIYYENLSGRRFLNFWRLWNMADIDYVLDVVQHEKPLDVQKIWDAKTKIHLRLFNDRTKHAKYINVHDYKPEDFFKIAEAAISIPYLHPKTKVKKHFFRDGEQTDEDLLQEVNYGLAADATDILIIYNRPEQKMINIFLRELLDFEHKGRIFEICPEELEHLSKFETRKEKLIAACEDMGKQVMQVFGGEGFSLQ